LVGAVYVLMLPAVTVAGAVRAATTVPVGSVPSSRIVTAGAAVEAGVSDISTDEIV